MRRLRTRLALSAGILAVLCAGSLTLAVSGAAAATPTQITLSLEQSVANPNGLALDALNWAGTGGGADKCTTAAVGAAIAVWNAAGAGCAGNFELIPVTVGTTPPGTSGPFEILYDPNGVIITGTGAPNGYCVSAVTDVVRQHAQLRGCTGVLNVGGTAASEATANPWQNVLTIPQTNDLMNSVALRFGTGNYANDQAYGGNGSPVISWGTLTGGLNQDWLVGQP